MTQAEEAVARFHKLLESDKFKNLEWAQALEEQIRGLRLAGGAWGVLPVLRPHFIPRRQYNSLVKAAEALLNRDAFCKQYLTAYRKGDLEGEK